MFGKRQKNPGHLSGDRGNMLWENTFWLVLYQFIYINGIGGKGVAEPLDLLQLGSYPVPERSRVFLFFASTATFPYDLFPFFLQLRLFFLFNHLNVQFLESHNYCFGVNVPVTELKFSSLQQVRH